MKERLESPDLWLEANIGSIHQIMAEFHAGYKIRERRKHPDYALRFDSSQRTLSEMEICYVSRRVAKKVGLPTGFRAVPGTLDAEDELGERTLRNHWFFLGRNREVMDLTAGQCMGMRTLETEPGYRMGLLQRRSPRHVRTFPNGISVVMGKAEDLAQDLGLVYSYEELNLNAIVTSPFVTFPIR